MIRNQLINGVKDLRSKKKMIHGEKGLKWLKKKMIHGVKGLKWVKIKKFQDLKFKIKNRWLIDLNKMNKNHNNSKIRIKSQEINKVIKLNKVGGFRNEN